VDATVRSRRILADDGSFVLNIGGSWNKGHPTRFAEAPTPANLEILFHNAYTIDDERAIYQCELGITGLLNVPSSLSR
jgi:hypothetical protein